ncbi:MAG: glycosyltransferase family 4 protein [Acidobacteria bacterium]|nr:glycosyltransferase family 4 protein [Acidobacteriota bacterium]
MRILHVADRLSDRGGADWALLGLLDALSGGHEQHLAVGRDDGAIRPSCPVTVVPRVDARTHADADLDPLMARLRPDIVHVHNVVNPAVLEWAVGVDAVMTVQDHRFFCPGRGKWTADGRVCGDAMGRDVCAGCFNDPGYFEGTIELTAQRLESVRSLRLTVLSSYMKRELMQVGIPADRIAVVPPFPYGLDPDAAADGPPCVLFAGRVVEAKGIREAIDAWRRSGSDLSFVVAGTGPLRREIEAEGVDVLGWLDRGRLSAAYRRAAVLIMPSRWQEPFGMAGIEALTLGTPVAAWDSGGVREWHPGGELLVPWGDVDGLAEALRAGSGRRVDPPRGFEGSVLVRRLEALYRQRAPRP